MACDADKDGYPRSEDCNDEDPFINPGAAEVCDDVDNDCDGTVDFPECADVFGRRFEIAILEAYTPYSWDGGILVTSASRGTDMKVSFGTEAKMCSTEEVENSSSAVWFKSCKFVLSNDGEFFIHLYDVDALATETISYWSWEDPASLFEFGDQDDGEYMLTENENWLRYSIEQKN